MNFDHEKEIEEMKQNFQKLIEEKTKQLKTETDISLKQKDQKINFLEEEIKKANDLIEKKFGDLTINLNSSICCKYVVSL